MRRTFPELSGTTIPTTPDAARAIDRFAAREPGAPMRRHPVRVKHPYWTSLASPHALIHIALLDGYMYHTSGHGFAYHGSLFLTFLCGAHIGHPRAATPGEEERRMCGKCLGLAQTRCIELLGTR